MNNPAGADASLMSLLFAVFQNATVFISQLFCWHRFFGYDCALKMWCGVLHCIRIYFCSALTFASTSMLEFAVFSCLSVVCVKLCFGFEFFCCHHHREPHSLALAFFSRVFVHSTGFAPFLRFQICCSLLPLLFHFPKKNRSVIFIFTNFYFYFISFYFMFVSVFLSMYLIVWVSIFFNVSGFVILVCECVCLFVCRFYMTKCLFVWCDCVVAEFYL